MNKIKTVIADDDHLVRSYLKMLSSWEQAGFEIVSDVRDGEEAMAALGKTEVKLLVTDLSMPLMDGIKLIREIRKTDRKIYIIVLSCHDEFEYVKEAMKEGADEYILKNTLNEKTLYELLISTKNKIEEQSMLNRKASAEVRQEDISAKYSFFNGVLAGGLKGETREDARLRAGILGTYQNSAVIALFLEEWEENEERWNQLEMEQYCQDFRTRLQDNMSRLLEKDCKRLEIIYLGKGVSCCFMDLSDMRKSSQMQQKLTSTASVCYKVCQKENYAYKIAVSNVCIGSESIRQAFQQAREMMKFSFYDDREILYYDVGKRAGTQLPDRAQALLNSVDRYVYQNRREEFIKRSTEAVEAFRDELTESRMVIQWLRQLERKAGIIRENGEVKLRHIRQLGTFLQEDAAAIFDSGRSVIPSDINKAVQVAAEFVLKHYKEPIGLTEAAQEAGVNSAYLSYLFQKEMKVGFSSFLLNRRMECARKMLEKTNLKVREVAEESGFQDYHYFSKAFKKMHGTSPAEYRKQLQ